MPASTGRLGGAGTAGVCDANDCRVQVVWPIVSAVTSVNDEATIVATRARSGVTSPAPSGCSRFDRKTTNTRRRRIDPDRGPGESRVAERSERQELAAIRRIRRIDVPAEPADVRLAGRRRRRRHPADGQRRQNARAADRAAAEQHAAVEREIRRGAEHPRVPGDAAHPPRGRIVHDAAQHLHVGPLARPSERRARLGRRDARHQRRRRVERRLLHPQRQEHALADELARTAACSRGATISASRKKLMSL